MKTNFRISFKASEHDKDTRFSLEVQEALPLFREGDEVSIHYKLDTTKVGRAWFDTSDLSQHVFLEPFVLERSTFNNLVVMLCRKGWSNYDYEKEFRDSFKGFKVEEISHFELQAILSKEFPVPEPILLVVQKYAEQWERDFALSLSAATLRRDFAKIVFHHWKKNVLLKTRPVHKAMYDAAQSLYVRNQAITQAAIEQKVLEAGIIVQDKSLWNYFEQQVPEHWDIVSLDLYMVSESIFRVL